MIWGLKMSSLSPFFLSGHLLESICRVKEIQWYSLECTPETLSVQLCSMLGPWKRVP